MPHRRQEVSSGEIAEGVRYANNAYDMQLDPVAAIALGMLADLIKTTVRLSGRKFADVRDELLSEEFKRVLALYDVEEIAAARKTISGVLGKIMNNRQNRGKGTPTDVRVAPKRPRRVRTRELGSGQFGFKFEVE